MLLINFGGIPIRGKGDKKNYVNILKERKKKDLRNIKEKKKKIINKIRNVYWDIMPRLGTCMRFIK